MLRTCTCKKCGWVHMAYTREQAQQSVDEFNDYFKKLPKKKRDDFYSGKKASISTWEACWCGSKEFRRYKKGDCRPGVTINPVIWERKK